MLKTGDIIDNTYRILSEAGRGGMSIVYLAINDRANKTWAVKEVRKDGTQDGTAVRRTIITETEMMKKLHHPNLPAIVDVIETEETFLIVMDYIEGISLAALLKEKGAQPEEQVVRWGKQLIDVLAYLHAQDPPIIYRDLKPSNIMLKPDGNLCLIDFGTAREFKNRGAAEDTVCLGTRGYAAPEQFGGRGETDVRTDIYSFGATLYHLLTGRSPAEPPYEIKPIGFWISGYKGSGLEKLVKKCTGTDPELRYQNCRELKEALDHHREEDEAARVMRKKAFTAFAGSVLIGAAALFAGFLFRHAWTGALNDSYENLLSQAMYQEDLYQAKPYFFLALESDPGRPEAYENLLEKAGAEIVKEDRLTSQTAQIINECLSRRPHGEKTNLETLKSRDTGAYVRLMYELGLWYFFLKDNSDEDRQTASVNYLSKITGEEARPGILSDAQQEMAEIMNAIGTYSRLLKTRMGRIGSDTENTYAGLFHDLEKMAEGDLKEKVGLDYYCIAVYRQIAYWIDVKESDFLSAGVGIKEMENLLAVVEDGLISLGLREENENYEDYKQALQVAENARKILESRQR